ncbi:YsnF/AvaK domain-containing protein [Mucilaginibacter arboris]|uniref:DUF2382 domain-containing protein n=1 Tax=Mucilaginibacter arboris TaxID=2682090 RepID=A0A7K1T1L4_9SPHI|nr:YsnF/AvaK domain-containing protein [Mucilaginibacter arboris]MVN23170.1 DUF2382 domain-containing protein [Mucilaginibacter arboris]
MSQTVIGIFDYTSEAQEAVNYLVNNGFSRSDIDLSSRASETEGTSVSNDDDEDDNSIGGFFSNLFGSNDEAEKYTKVGRKGSIVTVHAKNDQEAESAAKILDNYGAIDVNERAEQYKSSTTASGLTGAVNTNEADSIKIIEEKMNVGKREVETGGVRLRSRIVEQAVHEDVRLRTERVRVARTNVNRPATEADLANFKDATIEMTEHAEVPVVAKEAFVTGEVSLEKEVQENNETVQGTVRKTEVDTENLTSQDNAITTKNSITGGSTTAGDDAGFYK